MSTSVSKIARRFLHKAAEGDVPIAGRTDVPPEQFIDLSVFFLSIDAYRKLKGDDDPHLQKVVGLLSRFQDDFVDGVDKFLRPLVDDAAFTRFKSIVHQGTRRSRGLAQAALQAEMLTEVLRALHGRPTVLREVFSNSRAIATAVKVGAVIANDSPASVLNGLAAVPPASRLQVTRKWVREAAEAAGVAPSAVESVMADVSAATMIGADLHEVEAKLAGADPISDNAADLQDKKQALLADLDEVAAASTNPTVVLATAATVATQSIEYATKTAKAQRLSPDQERAMMSRGKAIIAAGAGSGKTATLASKVAYHVNELGVPPGAIIATSFSRKSAAELRRRIERYGAEIPTSAETGFGTTHSIAGKLMREYGGGGREGLKNYEQSNLVRLAMEQVQMKGPGLAPPEPSSLFAGLAGSAPAQAPGAPAAPPQPGLTFRDACQLAFDRRFNLRNSYLQSFIESYFNPRDKWYGSTMRATKNLTDPRGLSDKQANILREIFAKVGITYELETDPNFMTPPPAAPAAPARRYAAKDKDKGLREKYQYFSRPANQWFNLGLELTEVGPNGEKKPIPSGFFKQAITKFKGKAVSPSEAWKLTGGAPEAAVYAAYEWLKGPTGEVEFQNKGDFDDILLDVSKMILSNPRVLRQVQSRFKVVLVDEAQDLNRCVHGNTMVETPDGPVQVRDISLGARVLSFENGQIVYNRVLDKVRSSWERGYRIRTSSGRTLLMSPDHRIYATPLDGCQDGQMALYLMYRAGMGFRIGTSTRLFESRETSPGRAGQENADCAWILEVGEPDDILYKEQAYSLRYGIPTYIFNGAARGCDQERIDRIFGEFGQNGKCLLAEYDLDFQYPHWVSGAATRGKVARKVVNFCPHRGKGHKYVQRGSTVNMNCSTGDVDLSGIDLPVYTLKGGGRMVNKLTADYAEGRRFAEQIAAATGAYLVESLWIGEDKLRLITASGIFPGMKVPVWAGGVDVHVRDILPIAEYKAVATQLGVALDEVGGLRNKGKREIHEYLRTLQIQRGVPHPLPPLDGGSIILDEVVDVEVVEGGDYWDISVEHAHNFFGDGILSHNCQHLMFGLIAGFIDPAKVTNVANVKKVGELAKDDGTMTADTYCFIGDDKQCVDRNAVVGTRRGECLVGDLRPGDEILAYRNGKVVFQTVRHVVPSSWERGFRITTRSGSSLTMSPNHKLWASEPQTEEGQMAVYLMYQKDMGFRVGITNKGKVGSEDDYLASYGGRVFMEKAERLWIVDIVEGREEALLREQDISLTYGIPTTVFGGENRGLNQERIDSIFKKHGHNGARLLEARHLSFDLPHWMSQSYTKHGRERHTIQFTAHGNQGSCVSMEWEGPKFDVVLHDLKVSVVGDRRRLRRWFANYREGLSFAEDLAVRTGANLSYRLSTPEGVLRETTASGLFVGMSVPVLDEENQAVVLDEITSVEEVTGTFVDIDVMDASTFFANGILTSNSIYEFRGADPEAFIDMSDLVDGGAGFKTEVLRTNYRSGELIVEAANRLIAHNCVEAGTPILTPSGTKQAGDIVPGDMVVTYRDAKLAVQPVTEVVRSAWEYGLKITTTSGHTLTMSPNHRIWASEPIVGNAEVVVYLMYRQTHGFRVGVTKHGGRLRRDEGIGFGKRAAMEYGERMWVLGVFPDKASALTEETMLSLRYQIPMTTFNMGERGPSQENIDNIFIEFGMNGGRLLEERNLSFEYPHWSAQSQNRQGRLRDVVSIIAHAPYGTDVYWKRAPEGHVPRKRFHNYQEAREYAEMLAREAGGLLVEDKLYVEDADLRLMTASALLPGMVVPVLDSTVKLDAIQTIERVSGCFVDLGVAEDNNFFGGGILSHNSRQIPMTCKANPQRVDRGGIDVVRFGAVQGRDMSTPAAWLAAQIAEDIEEGRAGKKGYDAYGVGLRSNAEAYAYGIELLKKGIPFRSKANFFNDPNTKALLHWLTIADEGLTGDADRVNAAVLGARSAPATKLGPKFEENLTQMATGNYLVWLQSNWQRVYGPSGAWGDLVHTYVANLLKIAALKGATAEEVLSEVLALQGFDGRSVEDVLLDKVRDDEEALAELRAESPTGTVTEEAIAEMAFAPLAPLKGLLGARPDLTEAMKYTRQLQAANAKLTALDDPDAKGVNEPAVTLGTMHSWKGLEVENMFIPLVGGRFPRSDASEEDLASERRLAYVAVTRGENHVVVMDIPTVRMTKQGSVIQKSQFTDELCVPPSPVSGVEPWDDEAEAEAEVLAIEEANARVAGESPLDESAMDAYLQGQE